MNLEYYDITYVHVDPLTNLQSSHIVSGSRAPNVKILLGRFNKFLNFKCLNISQKQGLESK